MASPGDRPLFRVAVEGFIPCRLTHRLLEFFVRRNAISLLASIPDGRACRGFLTDHCRPLPHQKEPEPQPWPGRRRHGEPALPRPMHGELLLARLGFGQPGSARTADRQRASTYR